MEGPCSMRDSGECRLRWIGAEGLECCRVIRVFTQY
jgi:hypothetical protein